MFRVGGIGIDPGDVVDVRRLVGQQRRVDGELPRGMLTPAERGGCEAEDRNETDKDRGAGAGTHRRKLTLLALPGARESRRLDLMYRDASEHVDEHDRAAAAILMAGRILASCDKAVHVICSPAAPQPDRWHAVMRLHDTFPDGGARSIARVASSSRAAAHDRVRRDEPGRAAQRARRSRARPRSHGRVDESHLDKVALADAQRGLSQLKLALPSADWSAIEARTRGLADAKLRRHRRPRLMSASPRR